jgi:hypothetical protein
MERVMVLTSLKAVAKKEAQTREGKGLKFLSQELGNISTT